MMRILVAVFMGVMLVQPTSARITAENRAWIAQLTPTDRQWFLDQKAPGTGVPCCSEHDGEEVEEWQVGDHYLVRATRTHGEWVPVPPEAVLATPNLHGRAVVFWKYVEASAMPQNLEIRCFSPGAGL